MDLLIISKNRTALMGISAVMILICHSALRISMPALIAYPISYFNIGVDIFLLLSGMSMYYSLDRLYNREVNQKDNCFRGGVISWYTKRYIRILIPYCLIVLPFYGLFKYIEGESIINIVSYISTISFWTTHTGFWFIALILPLYVLSPFIFQFLTSKGLPKLILILIFCLTITLLPDITDTHIHNVFNNIQFVIIRVPSFILGFVVGKKIYNGDSIPIIYLVASSICAMALLILTRHFVYTYFFMTLPIVIVFSIFLEKIKKSQLYRCCSFFGKISLESYLFNGVVQPYVFWLIAVFEIPDYNNIIMYILVIILGTLLSVTVNNISQRICNQLNAKVIVFN